jgi:hypothetical protein
VQSTLQNLKKYYFNLKLSHFDIFNQCPGAPVSMWIWIISSRISLSLPPSLIYIYLSFICSNTSSLYYFFIIFSLKRRRRGFTLLAFPYFILAANISKTEIRPHRHVTAQTDISHPVMPRTTSHVLLTALFCHILLCLQIVPSLHVCRSMSMYVAPNPNAMHLIIKTN